MEAMKTKDLILNYKEDIINWYVEDHCSLNLISNRLARLLKKPTISREAVRALLKDNQIKLRGQNAKGKKNTSKTNFNKGM